MFRPELIDTFLHIIGWIIGSLILPEIYGHMVIYRLVVVICVTYVFIAQFNGFELTKVDIGRTINISKGWNNTFCNTSEH